MHLVNQLEAFRFFQFSFFQVKMVSHCEIHLIFQDIEFQIQEMSFITFEITAFYEIFIKLRGIFDSPKNCLLEVFATLPIYINYLHPNMEYMTILYFYDYPSYTCYRLLNFNK